MNSQEEQEYGIGKILIYEIRGENQKALEGKIASVNLPCRCTYLCMIGWLGYFLSKNLFQVDSYFT